MIVAFFDQHPSSLPSPPSSCTAAPSSRARRTISPRMTARRVWTIPYRDEDIASTVSPEGAVCVCPYRCKSAHSMYTYMVKHGGTPADTEDYRILEDSGCYRTP